MPAAVAHRLQSVVAQESARRQAAAAEPASSPRTPRRAVTLGHFGADRHRTPGWRRWVPVLAAATAAAVLGCGGYVINATAGLNEPPVVAAAINTDDLAAQAAGLEQSRDLDPHRFSNAWFCARSVARGRITGLAAARVDGSPALLVYTHSAGADLVTVVTGCGALQPSAIASAPIPR
ncbi:hypothetical protein [uncultured Friedmanniella sp.]|uniref:hypothetical protein n=1 Tax=uncultured Friedmanniella sp. TaxID=335381 RepID=UPI0035CABD52